MNENILDRAMAAGAAHLAEVEREIEIRQTIGEDNARLIREASDYNDRHQLPEPTNTRYQMKTDLYLALGSWSSKGNVMEALALAFNYGLARGYRAGLKAKRRVGL